MQVGCTICLQRVHSIKAHVPGGRLKIQQIFFWTLVYQNCVLTSPYSTRRIFVSANHPSKPQILQQMLMGKRGWRHSLCKINKQINCQFKYAAAELTLWHLLLRKASWACQCPQTLSCLRSVHTFHSPDWCMAGRPCKVRGLVIQSWPLFWYCRLCLVCSF